MQELQRELGGDLAYLWNGVTDGTPVVFLHGYSDIADCWAGLIDRLALPLPVYALDAPGHGYSVLHADGPFIEQSIERTLRFIEGLGRRVILVGHSMGAVQAMHIAGDAPTLVQAVVCEDPPLARDASALLDEAAMQAKVASVRQGLVEPAAATMARLLTSHPHWDAVEFEPMVRSTRVFDIGQAHRIAIHRETSDVTLTRLSAPTLLLTGDPARGALIDADTSAWAQRLCPTLRVVHFPETGHQLHRDAAESAASVVGDFIREHA